MYIAMTCEFNDSPVVLEIAATTEAMITQLGNWVVDGVLKDNVQEQVKLACAQEDTDGIYDGLLPILLENYGLVAYIQNVGGI